VENTGTGPVKAVNVTEFLPEGWSPSPDLYSYVSDYEPEGCVITSDLNSYTVLLNVSYLTAGGKCSFVVSGRSSGNSSGLYTNYAKLESTDNAGTALPEKWASSDVLVLKSDNSSIKIIKTVNKYDIEPGSVPYFTITIINPSSYKLSSVQVTDILPFGLTYRTGTSTIDGKAYTPTVAGQKINWTILTLPSKTISMITFQTDVNKSINSTMVNYANVTGISEENLIIVNDSTSISLSGRLANVSLYIYASNYTPNVNDSVDFSIVILNRPHGKNGGANVQPLIINDTLPINVNYTPNFSYVGDIRFEPTVTGNPSTGVNLIWNITDIAFLTPGQQLAIKYKTKVVGTSNISAHNNNTVNLTYLDPEVPGSCPGCLFDIGATISIYIWDASTESDAGIDYTLKLKKGWNLISLPVMPGNDSINSVLSSIEGKYVDVAAWNGAWEYRSYAYGDWFGELNKIEYGRGYWINMNVDADLIINGKVISKFNADLSKGWNLIGWQYTAPAPLSGALSSIDGKYTDLATWDGEWKYHSYAYGDWFGSLSNMEPGRGYWIYVTEPCKLSV